MKDLTLALFCLGLIALGTAAPFVMTLGYVWVSLVKPQTLAYGFFKAVPVAMIFGVLAMLTYLIIDRRSPPKLTALHVLTGLFAAWITVTTVFFALYNEYAWWKWDWAFKEVVFACFIPFVIRTRIHLEALLYTLTVGTVTLVGAVGLKALMTGGGSYGGLSVGGLHNAGLLESSIMAMYATMCIVLVIYLRHHTLIMPRNWIATLAVSGYIALCLLAALGGHARTGVVALAAMAFGLWWFSRHKLLLAVAFVIIAVAVLSFMSDEWFARMSTILDPADDASASTRLNVWVWTLGFVQQHPFGGGFGAHLANFGYLPNESYARAFHSIYFEVLGEHGYVGLLLFLAMIGTAMKMALGLYWRNRNIPELRWVADLGRTLIVSLITFCVGGAFVGIAFQPILYLLIAITIAARSCEIRVQKARSQTSHKEFNAARSYDKASHKAYPE